MGRIQHSTAHRLGHALEAWPEIENRLRRVSECFLFLDFDGTLSPIVSDPHRAELIPQAEELLHRLHRMAGMRIAIISGRNLNDIRSRVGLDLIYAGNHGLEIDGPGIDFVEEGVAELSGRIMGVCDDLTVKLAGIPGVLIERKGLTASVHLRRVAEDREAEAVAVVRRAVEPVAKFVVMRAGDKILELLPRVNWNKGKAARVIWQTVGEGSRGLPVCVGDDVTDEDLFREFPMGVTVRVGQCGETAARFFVESPEETLSLLERIGDFWLRSCQLSAVSCQPNRFR